MNYELIYWVQMITMMFCMGAGFWHLFARRFGKALLFFGIACCLTGYVWLIALGCILLLIGFFL